MKIIHLAAFAVACSFAVPASASQVTDLSSASNRGKVYSAKKAECKRQAKAKQFGIHFVERNRWINDCIAGHKS